MEVSLNYGFDQDSIIRLQKDLNHLLNNLDSQNVKKLYTDYCDIGSEKGETVIDGSLIDMYDYDNLTSQASTTLRLRMGYDASSSNFCFKLFNSAGIETISLDSCGNAVFKGDIDTAEDVNVGNNIYVGQSGSSDLKGIYFKTTTPVQETTDGVFDTAYASSNGVTGLFWNSHSEGLILNSTKRIEIMGLEKTFVGAGAVTASTELGSDYTLRSGVILTTDYASLYNNFGESYFDLTEGWVTLMSPSGKPFNIAAKGTSAYTIFGWFSTETNSINSWVKCSSDYVKVFSSGSVYLGYSTGNTYLGSTNLSTNLVATRGWVGAKFIHIRKTTECTVTNSTVMYPDPHMTLALEANTWYAVEAVIAPYSSSPLCLAVSWSTDGYYQQGARACIGASTDATDHKNTHVNIGCYSMSDKAYYSAGNLSVFPWVGYIRESFTIYAHSTGRLTLQWAPTVASATPLRMSFYTRMIVHKLT